jgi:hypothetical protein
MIAVLSVLDLTEVKQISVEFFKLDEDDSKYIFAVVEAAGDIPRVLKADEDIA